MTPIHITYTCADTNAKPAIIQVHPLAVPPPPAIPELINGQLSAVWISLRLQNLQRQWASLLVLFAQRDFQNYQFSVETVLVSMKRAVDDLVMCAYCIHKAEEIEQTRKIEVDGWGVLFRKGTPTPLGQEIIDRFIGEYDEFPNILNNLVNALKHSYLMPEARNEWNNEFPLVSAIYALRNDFSGEVEVHNHNMFELVCGFNQFVKQVMEKTHPHAGPCIPLDWATEGATSTPG